MIYVGVDGGGTKTKLVACENDTLISEAIVGPCNYNFIGVDAAVNTLFDGVNALNIPLSKIAAIGIGDPSIDDDAPMALDSPTNQFVKKLKSKLDLPIFIRSDAYMALFALTRGEAPAALILSGTGSMGIAEDSNKTIHIVGGWGRLLGDEGSGYYIAMEGIKAALQAIDGVGQPTALVGELVGYFNVQKPRDLIRVFYQDTAPDIASFSRIVSNCALQGDKAAKDILLQAARCLSLYACSLLKQSGASLLGVYGSVICNNAIVRNEFERLVKSHFPNIHIQEPPMAPEYAAALYAQKNFNLI